MPDNNTTTGWEDKLDQELDKLAALESSADPNTPWEPQHNAPEPERLRELDSRMISIREFRVEFADYIRNRIPLPVDVYDGGDRLLALAGSRITKNFVVLLRQRSITHVQIRVPAVTKPATDVDEDVGSGFEEDLQTAQTRMLDERAAGELLKPIVARPVRTWRRPRLPIDALKGEAVEGMARHAATSATVANLCQKLKPGRRTSAGELHRSVDQFVDAATADFDLLPLIVAMQETDDEYLFDHCVNVALLSVAMGCQLGLERDIIVEIGLGAMLQDIGMLRVPPSIRLAPRGLNKREWREIRRHPLHTLDMIADLRGIPQAIRFIGYQAHERMDGSGYPRKRQGPQLHECAKIVALADVYSAMTRARPYREAMSPYMAAKTILQEGAANKFDREMVRLLLDTVSLFPTGSRVCLTGGINARVLRANPGLHTRPVVEELDVDGSPTGHIIDLSRVEGVAVISAE